MGMIIEGMYDIKYTLENKTPIIKLYKRGKDGVKTVETIRNFQPYIYVPANEEILKSSVILSVENGLKTIDGIQTKKLTLDNPKNVYQIRKLFSKTYEADIPFTLRYLIDNVDANIATKYRVMFIDIETYSGRGAGFARCYNPVQPILCISWYDNYKEKFGTVIWHPQYKKEIIMKENHIEYHFNNENDMLMFFIKTFKHIAPDIVAAWNIGFDMPYLVSRLQHLGLPFQQLSPYNNVHIRDSEKDLRKKMRGTEHRDIEIEGCLLFDLLYAYRVMHLSELDSFSLKNVSQKELGESKDFILNLDKVWEETPEKFIKYNINDVELIKKINDKLKLIEFFEEIKNLAVLDNLNSCFFFSKVIDNIILRKYRGKIIFPSKPPYIQGQESIKGGLVLEPVVGIHKNVGIFDMKSLYPSIIKTFNLSYDTKLREGQTSEKYIEYEVKGKKIRIDQSKKGIIPGIIDDLLNYRKQYQDEAKKYSRASKEYDYWFQKAFVAKFLVNTVYGVNVLPSFRLHDMDVAESITFFARSINQWNADLAKTQGHTVIGGDTDSIFVVLKGDTIEEGKKLEKILNVKLNDFIKQYNITTHTMQVNFEKVFSPLIFFAKKRYAGRCRWKEGEFIDKNLYVGIDTVRSDSTTMSKRIQKKCIDMILIEETADKILEYIMQETKKICDVSYSYEELSIPTKLEKNIEEYDTNLPRCRAARWSNANLGTNYTAGSKYLMLYMHNGNGNDVVAFEDSKQLLQKFSREEINKKIDKERLLDTNIFMKLKRVAEVLGKTEEVRRIRENALLEEQGQDTLRRWF